MICVYTYEMRRNHHADSYFPRMQSPSFPSSMLNFASYLLSSTLYFYAILLYTILRTRRHVSTHTHTRTISSFPSLSLFLSLLPSLSFPYFSYILLYRFLYFHKLQKMYLHDLHYLNFLLPDQCALYQNHLTCTYPAPSGLPDKFGAS